MLGLETILPLAAAIIIAVAGFVVAVIYFLKAIFKDLVVKPKEDFEDATATKTDKDKTETDG